eukprot:GILJ01004687.1.p1 GENE.GILJ01004687.1~~GILJ01004687.1.p1  ORF type:complete len:248 (-),score=33.26 GILJ01004687.1:148-813(-)
MRDNGTAASPLAGHPLAVAARLFFLVFTGFFVLLTGIIHICKLFVQWCPAGASCIGQGLTWQTGGDYLNDVNGPNGSNWRSVFTLNPNVIFDLWAPFVLGLISMACFIPAFRWNAICCSWSRAFVWQLFVMLFGAFGYSGNFGIMIGFFIMVGNTLAFACAFVCPDEPCCFDIAIPTGAIGARRRAPASGQPSSQPVGMPEGKPVHGGPAAHPEPQTINHV